MSVGPTWPSGQLPLQLRVSVGLGKALPVPLWPVLSQCSLDKGLGKGHLPLPGGSSGANALLPVGVSELRLDGQGALPE